MPQTTTTKSAHGTYVTDVEYSDAGPEMTLFKAIMAGGKAADFSADITSGKINVNALHPTLGITALHLAAFDGRVDFVQELLKSSKIECNPKSESGHTPLHYAAESGHAGVVRVLLEDSRVKFEPRDNAQNTPLHRAALKGKKQVVEVFVADSRLVNADAENQDKKTAFELACNSEVADILKPKTSIKKKPSEEPSPSPEVAQVSAAQSAQAKHVRF